MSNKELKKQTVETILNGFKKNIFGIEYYYDKFGGLAQSVDIDEVKKTQSFLYHVLKK